MTNTGYFFGSELCAQRSEKQCVTYVRVCGYVWCVRHMLLVGLYIAHLPFFP
jgi:hypothetical protein